MPEDRPTTGVPGLDRILGGLIAGDNVVLEGDSGAPVDSFVADFVASSAREGSTLVYVSFDRSPQTIAARHMAAMSPGRLILVDGFSSGKGRGDKMFLEFFRSGAGGPLRGPIHLDNPSDPATLERALLELCGGAGGVPSRYIFDSLTGMQELWGGEDRAFEFFGHFCPRLYDLHTVAYWVLEKEAHSREFLAKIRHVTQVVLEVGVRDGVHSLTVRKAAGRACGEVGVPRRFAMEEGRVSFPDESRSDRELRLLTRLAPMLSRALEPAGFFEEVMGLLAAEMGMIRGTLVLLDRVSGRLRIAAAHGLTPAERARGEYGIGEGVTGLVVKTGKPEIVPDVAQDERFLNRTEARTPGPAQPVSFICVPVRVDDEVVGALSVDRPWGVAATLEKDLRLLLIVASTISQVLAINRLVLVEKEEILERDKRLSGDLRERYRLESVAGESEGIRACLATAATAAASKASVLVTGETGTGKELVARVVHFNSPRQAGPFVKVDCGALPETLLESELFGHVRGAFTGAIRDRKGRFERADGGTIFLDEIGEMSPRLQVKLLRVLQEREFEPVGGERTVSVDVRVVAATNRDLKEEISKGRFREDLFYRLNVIPIRLPPLRERRADIPLLVNRFLEKFNRENGKSVTKLSRQVMDLLMDYPWPGNVRELENCIERAVVMSPGETLSGELLPDEIRLRKGAGRKAAAGGRATTGALGVALSNYLESQPDIGTARLALLRAAEEAVLRKAMAAPEASQREVARLLGLSRVTLRKKLRELGLL